MNRFWSSLLIVVSLSTYRDPAWKPVVNDLVAKHPELKCDVLAVGGSVTDSLEGIKERKPRYVAFVMKPEEARFMTILELKRMMRRIDDDPFDDAIWGIVSGPTAADARRIASSKEPARFDAVLSTTGLSTDIVSGPVVKLSDANPPGEWVEKAAGGAEVKNCSTGDLSHVFAKAWNELDPQFLLTSSHASQRNLEMPFSRGNIVPFEGGFATCPDLRMIDYRTGQAQPGVARAEAIGERLKAPKREKVWLASGNCLIADNAQGANMVMTALGFGKVNQFVGYIATTWFGEIGWDTWKYFGTDRLPLNESYYFANQFLLKKLTDILLNQSDFHPVVEDAESYNRIIREIRRFEFKVARRPEDGQQLMGMLWDRDATCFWGDPAQEYALPASVARASDLPRPIVFPSAKPGRKLLKAPDGFEVFTADDFALVLKWPGELKPGWEKELEFSE